MVPAPQPGVIHPVQDAPLTMGLRGGEAVSQTRLKRPRRAGVVLRKTRTSRRFAPAREVFRFSEKPGVWTDGEGSGDEVRTDDFGARIGAGRA
jgi:hypothetical protein